jgi:hypothetical protein
MRGISALHMFIEELLMRDDLPFVAYLGNVDNYEYNTIERREDMTKFLIEV